MKELKIKSTILYHVFDENMVILKEGQGLFLNDTLVTKNTGSGGYLLNKTNLLFSENTDFKLKIFDTKSSMVTTLGNLSFVYSSFDGRHLIGLESNRVEKSKRVVKFDFNRKEVSSILFDDQNLRLLFANTKFAIVHNRVKSPLKFTFYNHQTETTLWQYDTSVLGIEKIGKILGVFEEVLVVVGVYENPDPRYSDQYELYMGLDIKTGHLIWQQKEVLINQKMSPLGGLSFNLQFKKDSLLLEALLGDYYWKLNSQTGEIKAESIKEQLDEKGIDVTMSSSISDTHLYFKAHVLALGGFAKCIGSFDTQSLKIDWLHIFEDFQETGAFIRNAQPKISGNKVYALDYNNTLHIFERE